MAITTFSQLERFLFNRGLDDALADSITQTFVGLDPSMTNHQIIRDWAQGVLADPQHPNYEELVDVLNRFEADHPAPSMAAAAALPPRRAMGQRGTGVNPPPPLVPVPGQQLGFDQAAFQAMMQGMMQGFSRQITDSFQASIQAIAQLLPQAAGRQPGRALGGGGAADLNDVGHIEDLIELEQARARLEAVKAQKENARSSRVGNLLSAGDNLSHGVEAGNKTSKQQEQLAEQKNATAMKSVAAAVVLFLAAALLVVAAVATGGGLAAAALGVVAVAFAAGGGFATFKGHQNRVQAGEHHDKAVGVTQKSIETQGKVMEAHQGIVAGLVKPDPSPMDAVQQAVQR